jgi:ornithine cyclodeaminase/alanine dehydrogenase-like protein (mu-crystallin family)
MKASEIIKADAVKRKVDPDKALQTISALVKEKSAILMQENDSVLLVRKIGDTSAEIHLFTKDKPNTLAKSVIAFVKKGKGLGIKTVYGMADNPQIVDLMKRIGMKLEASDIPQYNWKAQI